MRRDLLEAAAEELAADLFTYERHCDAAIAAIARMTLKISSGREPAGLPIHHGQPALDELVLSLVAATAARRHACDLHTALGVENKRLGEPARNLGDGGKPPAQVAVPLGQAT